MTLRDQEEQDVRITKTLTEIEKLRADIRWETRRFVVSAILATAASVGAGVAVGNLIWAHHDAPTVVQPPR